MTTTSGQVSAKRTGVFTVGKEDTNELGQISTCRILNEITARCDEHLVAAFGDMGVYRKLAIKYEVNFMTKALRGDVVRVDSRVLWAKDDKLEISVTLRRANGKQCRVAMGRFVYTQKVVAA